MEKDEKPRQVADLPGLFVPLQAAVPHNPELSGVGMVMLMIMEDGNIEFCFLRGEGKLLNQFIEGIWMSFCADHANYYHTVAVEPINNDVFLLESTAPAISQPEFWKTASWAAFWKGGKHTVHMAHQRTVKGIGFFRAGQIGKLRSDLQQQLKPASSRLFAFLEPIFEVLGYFI